VDKFPAQNPRFYRGSIVQRRFYTHDETSLINVSGDNLGFSPDPDAVSILRTTAELDLRCLTTCY
jgi:hypothetical protein